MLLTTDQSVKEWARELGTSHMSAGIAVVTEKLTASADWVQAVTLIAQRRRRRAGGSFSFFDSAVANRTGLN